MKKRSIALALCCAFLCTPVSAKTFVGVLYPLFGPVAAFGLVDLVSELKHVDARWPVPADLSAHTYDAHHGDTKRTASKRI